MAGCAMIGQTMINVRASRRPHADLDVLRRRVPAASSSSGSGGIVAVIPMAALVAVMILVVGLDVRLAQHRARHAAAACPSSETVIMLATVGVTVATHNLAIGVGVGVLTAMAVFARRVAHLVDVERVLDPDGTTSIYSVTGELFFASDQELIDAFDYADDPPNVIIDLSRAHVWDASAVAALDAISTHYERHGIEVEITGLNRHSEELHSSLSGQLAAAH